MKKITLSAFLIIAVLFTAIAYAAPPDLRVDPRGDRFTSVSTTEFSPDEVVIEFNDDTTKEEADDIITKTRSKKVYESRYKKIRIAKIPKGKTFDEYKGELELDGKVRSVRRNYIVRADFMPDDPLYPYQWHFDNTSTGGINMPQAWEKSTGQGVIVAVVDTGVAYETYTNRFEQAPDLANTTFVPGWDFVNNDSHPNDDEGHGTHVTGTIAQSTNNGLGVAGIAYNAAIMPVKVLDKNGSGTSIQVGDGIRFAADNGADIINLSLGSSSPDPYIESSCQYAYDLGVTIIASSGNDGAAQVGYPGAFDDYVIAVGATRFDEQKAYYSNAGTSLDIVAPGGDINVDQNNDTYADGVLQQTFAANQYKNFGYYFYQGTSMAAPHVSGVAALILASNPSFTPDQIRNTLQSSADDLGDPGWDTDFGWGLLNADAALPSVAISINTDGMVGLGILDTGDTSSTSSGDHEIISVDTGPADLSVKSTGFSDGSNNWTLASSNAADQVKWEFSSDNSVWNTFLLANTYYSLAVNIAETSTQPLYLRLTMPTSTSSNAEFSSNITILATSP